MSSTSTVFKTVDSVPNKEETLPVGKSQDSQSFVDVEKPYLDRSTADNPYLAEYFQLGDTWNERQGGFPEEIAKIESYLQDKINSGEIANSINAVKDTIRNMEKINNLSKEERAVVKIEVLANYVDFIEKNKRVFSNLNKYGVRN